MIKMEMKDIRQIEDGLFAYVKKIQNVYPVYLEYFPDSKNTCLCFKRNADPVTDRKSVV